MLRIGQANLTDYRSGEDIFFLWSEGNGVYERLDVIDNLNRYEVINTSNCIGAYWKDSTEKIYGNNDVITTMFRIKHESSLMHAKEEKEVKFEDGKIKMVITKSIPELNLYYEVVMENRDIISEYYQTNEGSLSVFEVNKTDSNFKPVNIDMYENCTTMGDASFNIISVDGAEFLSYDDLIRKYPQVLHVLDNDYVVIRSLEEAEERLKLWIESKEQLKSVDIESLDKVWGIYSNNKITGVFLGYGTRWSTYFPFRQQNFKYNLPIEFLRKIFDAVNNQPPAPEVLILSHNSKFEIEGFYQEFRDFLRVDVDTYLLAVLANPVVKKNTHDLKSLTGKVDSKFYLKLTDIFIGKIAFNVLTEDIVLLYGCPDATSPAKIYPWLLQQIPKDETFVCSLENKLPYIKAMNEFYGLPIDQSRLQSLLENEQYKVDKLANIFRSYHNTSRNINSYQVLKEILYDKLRCPVEVTTQKGLPATSVVAINRIKDLGTIRDYDKNNVPADIVDLHGKAIVEGKELAGNKYPSLVVYSTYKKSMKELGALNRIKTHSMRDRFMFYINQSGAGSNRQTSDAHQFSDTMKSCVVADSPHHGLVSCDYKQVELRVLPWLAGQQDLIELEKDPGVDIHRAILSIIQGKPMYLISEEDRKAGKSVNFGVVYMMTEYGLAARDFGPAYTKEELRIERKKITDFFNGLPYIKMYLAKNEHELKTTGMIKTKFNYYRYFPELLDPTVPDKLKKTLVRSGNNTPVQGTAAQMLKMVEVRIWEYIKERGWHIERDYDGVMLPMVRMMLPIHDEILLSYDKERITKEEIIVMFKECMELEFEGAPPFFAAPAFINNWYDGKDPVYEVDIPFRDKVVENYRNGIMTFEGRDYIGVLKEYRDSELSDYMHGLIAQYVDPEEVWKHVDDDNLTHTLIETMIPKSERKSLTHLERIEVATKRYMEEKAKGGKITASTETKAEIATEASTYVEPELWLQTYSKIDADGNLIVEDEEEFEEIEDTVVLNELMPYEDRFAEECHSLYFQHECWVDLTSYNIQKEGNDIYQELVKLHNPTEFYDLILVIGKKTIQTGIKIGHIPKEIDKIFERVNQRLQEVK